MDGTWSPGSLVRAGEGARRLLATVGQDGHLGSHHPLSGMSKKEGSDSMLLSSYFPFLPTPA